MYVFTISIITETVQHKLVPWRKYQCKSIILFFTLLFVVCCELIMTVMMTGRIILRPVVRRIDISYCVAVQVTTMAQCQITHLYVPAAAALRAKSRELHVYTHPSEAVARLKLQWSTRNILSFQNYCKYLLIWKKIEIGGNHRSAVVHTYMQLHYFRAYICVYIVVIVRSHTWSMFITPWFSSRISLCHLLISFSADRVGITL